MRTSLGGGLNYPFEGLPSIGDALPVAPGVHWLRMHLPLALAVRFYAAAGGKNPDLEHYQARFGEFGKMIYALPDSYHRVTGGDQFVVGGRVRQAVIGRGHSPEQACLYCPELRAFISGDQILPKITPNVSVFPTEPDADPLTDWLEFLTSIRAAVD